MIRLLFAIVGGILLGGIVHLVSVLALPRIASQDAYSRLTEMTTLNAVTPLPPADPANSLMPFMVANSCSTPSIFTPMIA